VLEAEDGREGVSQFRRHVDQVRFVVLDLTMPVMDGWQALAAMRRVRADVPVLLCTGHNEDSIANPDPLTTCLLFKPFRLVDLQRAVNRLLNPNHSSPPVPT
jgi:CheY-like chemotaxis protein